MRLGPYEVLSEVGRGGAGVVYKARSANGDVAIKVLQLGTPEHLARFDRERRLGASFTARDGFVPQLDFGVSPAGPYLVMPFVTGGTLRARLERGPLSVAETVRLGLALGRALGRAHASGLVHRDLKPENILFHHGGDGAGEWGQPLVADLGLAKSFEIEAGSSSASVLSARGQLRGTAGYMAPEQMEDARSVGPEADVFALGAILWECLAGRPAFGGATLVEVLASVAAGEVAPIGRVRQGVPRWLASAIDRALARDPAARPSDGTAFANALSRSPRRVPLVALAIALLVATAAVLAPRLLRRESVEPRPTPVKPPAPPPTRRGPVTDSARAELDWSGAWVEIHAEPPEKPNVWNFRRDGELLRIEREDGGVKALMRPTEEGLVGDLEWWGGATVTKDFKIFKPDVSGVSSTSWSWSYKRRGG